MVSYRVAVVWKSEEMTVFSAPMPVVPLQCCCSVLCVFSANGAVFSWGSGQYGRLGQGHLRDRYAPLMISDPLREVKVTQVACNEFHSAAVCGECVYVCMCVYMCGVWCVCVCMCFCVLNYMLQVAVSLNQAIF